MSDNALDPDLKERAELISGVLTTVLEEQGLCASGCPSPQIFRELRPGPDGANETPLLISGPRIPGPCGLYRGLT
jgi:hypothetical protein